MTGLSGPQALVAKGFAVLLIGSLLVGIVNYHASVNFKKGVASKAVYINTLEVDLSKALSDLSEKTALLESCETAKNKAQGEVIAHLKQNEIAAKLAAETLLQTQKNNAQALARLNQNQNADKAFYENVEKRMKGLLNECDANGNSIVRGGADLLRDVRNRQQK